MLLDFYLNLKSCLIIFKLKFLFKMLAKSGQSLEKVYALLKLFIIFKYLKKMYFIVLSCKLLFGLIYYSTISKFHLHSQDNGTSPAVIEHPVVAVVLTWSRR
jgi:hypothetical protein